MSTPPVPPGKLPGELMARLLAMSGDLPSEVLVGPAVGEDACVLDVPGGALVAATDPVTLTRVGIGRHAVIVNANDVAVTGTRPRWFLAAVLLPPGTTRTEVEALFSEVRAALDELGATLVGGHSEVTASVTQPVVVGQMLGLAEDGRFVRTGGARPGDVVLQVGLAPVEGGAVLAAESTRAVEALDPSLAAAAAAGLHQPGISVVEAALAATGLGATALHDPTEGGLAAGLHELAVAAGVALEVDPARALWFEPAMSVCQALGADPWATLASGCLLAAFEPGGADTAQRALRDRGYDVAALARAGEGSGVRTTDGRSLAWPERDELSRLIGD